MQYLQMNLYRDLIIIKFSFISNNTGRQNELFLWPKTGVGNPKDFGVLKTNPLSKFLLYVRIFIYPNLKVKKWPFSDIFQTILHYCLVLLKFHFHFKLSLTDFYFSRNSTLLISRFKKYLVLHGTYSVLRGLITFAFSKNNFFLYRVFLETDLFKSPRHAISTIFNWLTQILF